MYCNTSTVMCDPTENVNKNYNTVLRAVFQVQLKSVFTLNMDHLK